MGEEIIRGCSFLTEDHNLEQIFIPEEFNDEAKMIGKLTSDFVAGSVQPKMDALEALEAGVMDGLLKEAGQLGLLAVDIPADYGGFAQTKAIGMLLAEKLGPSGSFQVGHGAHSGIGTLPIVYFGTAEQKQKYLPALATGELLAAYALTEAGSGSDAMNAKSKAVLSEDGSHYLLNGEKMFITNAGFADIFIVFAKVDGDMFTSFILNRDMEGLSTGAEEKKLGIKGSSTRALVMEDVKVPVENLLGHIGRGHEIAFNILNVGRFKLGAGAVGASIATLIEAVKYAKGREQFGKPISSFGFIKHKIGESAARIFAARCMVYRTAGHIDQNIALLDASDENFYSKMIKTGIREYTTECSMLKVFCSEVLDYVVDETLQIHGGYGYVSEYNAERYYRDSRINRIFEGTNEINRWIIGGEVLKKAINNDLPLFAQAKALLDELAGIPSLEEEDDSGFMSEEAAWLALARKAVVLSLGTAAQELGEKLKELQEVLGYLSDMIIDVYGMDSAIKRVQKMKEMGVETTVAEKMTRLFCNDAMDRIETRGREVLASSVEGDMLTITLRGLRRTMKRNPVNTLILRREIADVIIDKEEWPISTD
ncbi:MAG: acyl-CoA dehydrogenase family protein [Candidatus Krumholzibacteria bacterium]|nr:acyl-CoA dehydrogenase family protein [Candidatus Krumholzibacteria bacterium]